MPNHRDHDLNEELQAHLAHEIDQRMARGESPEEAERNARLEFGNLTQVAEQTRESWRYAFLTGFWQDLTFAWRLMRKSPVFTLAAVASLALGIGANTAIYSVFSKALRDPLAVHQPQDLFQLAFRTVEDKPDEYHSSFSYPFIQEIQRNAKTIQGATCSAGTSASYRSGNLSRILGGELVCGNLFDVLGLKPSLGRLFTPQDNITPGAHSLVVLAHHFWSSEFNSDPSIIGRQIELNQRKFTVIGVAPKTYFSMRKGNIPAYFIPIVMDGTLNNGPTDTTSTQSWWIRVMLRRKPDATEARMNAELTALRRNNWDRYERPTATDYAKKLADSAAVQVLPAARGFDAAQKAAEYDKPLQLLMAVVGAVLLIACINIANLLLARAAAREREIATRLAIGASRWRLIRQFLTESLALSALGGLTGLALSLALERILMVEAFGKASALMLNNAPTPAVLLITLGLSVIAGLGFGLIPALTADRQGIRSTHRLTGRKLMVSFQVALSILLLSGAGLFLQTLNNLRNIDSGFNRENLISMAVTPQPAGRSKDALLAYFRNLTESVGNVPGVRSVALSNIGLLSGSQWSSGLQVAGVVVPPNEPGPLRNAVGPNFFTVIGAKFLEGRDFIAADNQVNAAKVTIVNESFARRYFGNSSALGRKIGRGSRPDLNDQPDFTIIGVVKNLRDSQINGQADRYWYVPYEQQERLNAVFLNVRTHGDPTSMMAAVKAAVAQVDPDVPTSRETTMTMAVEAQIGQERLVARLSAFFALVALLLAVVGLYGVMAYTVERRSREIGIRLALGESRRQVLNRFLGEALTFIGIGVLIGVPMALALGSYAEKILYGVKPADMFSISIAVLSILLFGTLAGYLTARRAASIEPSSALRCD
jgi:predicted permease